MCEFYYRTYVILKENASYNVYENCIYRQKYTNISLFTKLVYDVPVNKKALPIFIMLRKYFECILYYISAMM